MWDGHEGLPAAGRSWAGPYPASSDEMPLRSLALQSSPVGSKSSRDQRTRSGRRRRGPRRHDDWRPFGVFIERAAVESRVSCGRLDRAGHQDQIAEPARTGARCRERAAASRRLHHGRTALHAEPAMILCLRCQRGIDWSRNRSRAVFLLTRVAAEGHNSDHYCQSNTAHQQKRP